MPFVPPSGSCVSACRCCPYPFLSALDTFRRLIKHSYAGSYAKDQDNKPLELEELLAMIHMANAFEFTDAVRDCAAAIRTYELKWEQAIQCIALAK